MAGLGYADIAAMRRHLEKRNLALRGLRAQAEQPLPKETASEPIPMSSTLGSHSHIESATLRNKLVRMQLSPRRPPRPIPRLPMAEKILKKKSAVVKLRKSTPASREKDIAGRNIGARAAEVSKSKEVALRKKDSKVIRRQDVQTGNQKNNEWEVELPVPSGQRVEDSSNLQKLSKAVMPKYRNETGLTKIVAVNLNIGTIDQLPRRLRNEVRAIYLGNNSIRHMGGLLQFPNLRVASLANNLITDIGDVEMLSNHPTLESLYLDGNPISQLPTYRMKLMAALPQLRMLDGRAVPRHERGKALQATKKENAKIAMIYENDLIMKKLAHVISKTSLHKELFQVAYGRASVFNRSDHFDFPILPNNTIDVDQLLKSASCPLEGDQLTEREAKQLILKRLHKSWLKHYRHIDPTTARLSSIVESWFATIEEALSVQQRKIARLVGELEAQRMKLEEARQKRKGKADTEGFLLEQMVNRSEKTDKSVVKRPDEAEKKLLRQKFQRGTPEGEMGETDDAAKEIQKDRSSRQPFVAGTDKKLSKQTKFRQMDLVHTQNPEYDGKDNVLFQKGGWFPSEGKDVIEIPGDSGPGITICDVWTQTPPDRVVANNLQLGSKVEKMKMKVRRMVTLNEKLRERLGLFQKQNLVNVQHAEAELRAMSEALDKAVKERDDMETKLRRTINDHETYREAAETSLKERSEETKELHAQLLARVTDLGAREHFMNQIDHLKAKAGAISAHLYNEQLEKNSLKETVKALRRALSDAIEVGKGDKAAKELANRLVLAEAEVQSLRTELRIGTRENSEKDRMAWMDGPTEETRRKNRKAISHRHRTLCKQIMQGWWKVVLIQRVSQSALLRMQFRRWKLAMQTKHQIICISQRAETFKAVLAVRRWRKFTTFRQYNRIRLANADRQANQKAVSLFLHRWMRALRSAEKLRDRQASINMGRAVKVHTWLSTRRAIKKWRFFIKEVVIPRKRRLQKAKRFRQEQVMLKCAFHLRANAHTKRNIRMVQKACHRILFRKFFQGWIEAFNRSKQADELLRSASVYRKRRTMNQRYKCWRKALHKVYETRILAVRASEFHREISQRFNLRAWVTLTRDKLSEHRIDLRLLKKRALRSIRNWHQVTVRSGTARKLSERALLHIAEKTGRKTRLSLRRWRRTTVAAKRKRCIIERMSRRICMRGVRTFFLEWERKWRLLVSNRLSEETRALSDAVTTAQAAARTLETEVASMRPALARQAQVLGQLQRKLLNEKSEMSRLRSRNLVLTSGQNDLKNSLKDVISAAKTAQAKAAADARKAKKEAKYWQGRYAHAKETFLAADVMMAETLEMFQRMQFDSVSRLSKWTHSAMARIGKALRSALEELDKDVPNEKPTSLKRFSKSQNARFNSIIFDTFRKDSAKFAKHGQWNPRRGGTKVVEDSATHATISTGSIQSSIQSAPPFAFKSDRTKHNPHEENAPEKEWPESAEGKDWPENAPVKERPETSQSSILTKARRKSKDSRDRLLDKLNREKRRTHELQQQLIHAHLNESRTDASSHLGHPENTGEWEKHTRDETKEKNLLVEEEILGKNKFKEDLKDLKAHIEYSMQEIRQNQSFIEKTRSQLSLADVAYQTSVKSRGTGNIDQRNNDIVMTTPKRSGRVQPQHKSTQDSRISIGVKDSLSNPLMDTGKIDGHSSSPPPPSPRLRRNLSSGAGGQLPRAFNGNGGSPPRGDGDEI